MLYARDLPDGPTAPLMASIARYGAEHCAVTIVEGILYSQRYDSLFRALADMFDDIHTYYFDVSFEETRRRHETRPQQAPFGPEHISQDRPVGFRQAIFPQRLLYRSEMRFSMDFENASGDAHYDIDEDGTNKLEALFPGAPSLPEALADFSPCTES